MDLSGRDVGPGAGRIRLGRPAVAFQGLGGTAEMPEDVAPPHVRVRVVWIYFDGPVVRRKRIPGAPHPRKDATNRRVRVRVVRIGRDRLAVPSDRLVVPAEYLGDLAGDHVQDGRIHSRLARLLDGLLAAARQLVCFAARPGPAYAVHQKDGRKRLYLH